MTLGFLSWLKHTQFSSTSLKVDEISANLSTMMVLCSLHPTSSWYKRTVYPIYLYMSALIHYIRRYTLVAVNTLLLNFSNQVALIRLSQTNEASFSGNMRPCSVSIVNGDGWRMGKVAVLLVTLTCVALLPRCHSQGEVRVTECKGCTL